jgi:hypothetical protein
MTSFDPGGTERQMIELVRRLDPARWAVHIACFHTRGAWFSRAREVAASVAEFPVTSFQSPRALKHMWAFARWCRAQKIAVAHTTELYSNIFGLPGAALAGVPVRIGNRREINPDKSPAQIALQRVGYSVAHKIVANSHAAADRLRAEGVPARKIAVIPNGLDATVCSRVNRGRVFAGSSSSRTCVRRRVTTCCSTQRSRCCAGFRTPTSSVSAADRCSMR